MLKALIIFISLIFITSGFWISYTFDKPSFEQILFYFQFGITGMIDSDIGFIINYLIFCFVTPLILTIVYYKFDNILLTLNRINRFLRLDWKNPYLILVIALGIFTYKIGLPNHLKKRFTNEDYFSNNYINPNQVEIKNISKPKNLILIYVESLENTFSDSNIFGQNLLEAIDISNVGGQSFGNYNQIESAHWTTAGIVATQCGMPLRPIISQLTNVYKAKTFLPNAVCLGDVLKQNKYQSIFINGMNVDFAGINIFLHSHGYDEVYGKEEILAKGFKPKKMESFSEGINDQDLFDYAKTIIDQKEEGNTPYNLTILTLDTHSPDGYPSSKCNIKANSSLSKAVLCTAEGLADLINYIKNKGYLKNTNIVIIGDHLFMADGQKKKTIFFKNRTIFNRFIFNEPLIMNRDEIIPFDLFPTILYSLGFDTEDGKLGLGYNGFGNAKNLPDNDRVSILDKKLLNYSKGYLELWTSK